MLSSHHCILFPTISPVVFEKIEAKRVKGEDIDCFSSTRSCNSVSFLVVLVVLGLCRNEECSDGRKQRTSKFIVENQTDDSNNKKRMNDHFETPKNNNNTVVWAKYLSLSPMFLFFVSDRCPKSAGLLLKVTNFPSTYRQFHLASWRRMPRQEIYCTF